MAIDPTTQIKTVLPPAFADPVNRTDRIGSAAAGGASFGELVRDALDQLNRLQQEADNATTNLITGEPVDLHDVMIAVQKADLGFQLALQVRNKLVEAYQEIMRMQV